MWKCPQCHESLRDSFEVCWNCGTSKDGSLDPGFASLKELEREPEPSQKGSASCSEPIMLHELGKNPVLNSATALADGIMLGGWLGGLLAALGLAWIFRPFAKRRSEPRDATESRDRQSSS